MSLDLKVPPETTVLSTEHSTRVSTPTDLIEKKEQTTSNDLETQHLDIEHLDIEHLAVVDDPRLWSSRRKSTILGVIALASMSGVITVSIFFPALASLQSDLNASDGEIAATVSLYILCQGVFPMIWSGISEIKGRRICYITSILIYCISTAVCSRANSIGVFIAMRILQAAGSSAVLALGAGTLADIYDVEERGYKLGIYYAVPLAGPSVGSLIGGAITSGSSWRGTFYFLLGYGVICLLTMIWLPETFRKERSFAYRAAIDRARAHAKEELLAANAELPNASHEHLPTPKKKSAKTTAFAEDIIIPSQLERSLSLGPIVSRIRTTLSLKSGGDDNLKIHFRDVNPFSVVGLVLRQPHNFLATTFSGLLFASQYSLSFSASKTFAEAPYNFGALDIGLVLLSFGVGNIVGSVGGGKYSDIVLRKLKIANNGVSEPEFRIKSTFVAMFILPPTLIAYAWVVQKEVAIYWPVIILFIAGVATIWMYSSTLAFIVDANPGRSSSAVACNSLFRGVLAAIAAQVATPAINGIGNGWYYTIFACILIGGELGLWLISIRGKRWREYYRDKEERKMELAKELEKST